MPPARAERHARSRPARATAPRPAAARPTAPSVPWISCAVGGAFLLAYLALSPTVSGPGDSSEFTAVLATLGLAHPTGYAIYTLLGHGFVVALHALGATWPWAANAWSALGGAVAITLWHALAARLLARAGTGGVRGAGLALLPALAFGLNPAWTAETTLAEVNSWHGAWVAAACLLASQTIAGLVARRSDRAWVARRVAAWSALVGLGAAHHATSLWFALPLTIALLAAAWPIDALALAPAGLALVAPLAAWCYVDWRGSHPAVVQWPSLAPGARATWEHVTAAGYRHFLGGFHPAAAAQSELARHVYPWLVPGLVALCAWPFLRAAEPRATRFALAGAAVLQVAYALIYGVADPTAYFLPALALGLIVLPACAAAVGTVRRAAVPLGAAAALGIVVASVAWSKDALTRRHDVTGLDAFLHTMWRAVPITRGYVLWDDDMSERLVQYQVLDGEHPGLVVVHPRLLMDEGTRGRFARQHGFDPLGGAAPPSDATADLPETIAAFANTVGDGINRGSRDSVILFLPREPSLRLLPKLQAPSDSATARR